MAFLTSGLTPMGRSTLRKVLILSTDGAAFFSPSATNPPNMHDVVVMNSDGTVSTTTASDDLKVVGVRSTDPGFIFQGQYPLEGGVVPVTLMGTVLCNVDNSRSLTSINVGD